MNTEETKGNESKTKGTDSGCCNPENFRKMFETMGRCFQGQCDAIDFSAMKDPMMKKMMDICCPLKTTDSKDEIKPQKEREGETESTE